MLTVSLLVCALMALTKANGDENASLILTKPVGDVPNITALFNLPNAAVCPQDWKQYGGRCFFHETTIRSWAQSQLHCQSLSGNLASIHSDDEYNFIQQITSDIVWVGGSDCQEAGAWLWIDGAPLDFKFWCPSKPGNTREDCCMQMNTGDGQCWADVACNTRLPSICVKTP